MSPHRSPRLAALVLVGAGCRGQPGDAPTPPLAPPSLQVDAGQRLYATALGKGVQIYVCKAGEGGAFAWKLQAPEAELLDPQGKPIGKHYGGPTWESTDGSKAGGEVAAKAEAPLPGAIPWLLLRARSTSGDGAFARVKSVQRVDTRGGVAPPGCDAAHADAEVRVDYQATYRFYGAP